MNPNASASPGHTHHSAGLGMSHLLPEWLAIVAAVIFLAIAASHLRHMVQTAGQRRPWHASHVLIAVGMAFMYAPLSAEPWRVPAAVWQLLFTGAGIIAALWALGGNGRVPTLMWLLTSVELGAMVYMWSPHTGVTVVGWLLVAYFLAEAAMWALDAYRRVDGRRPVIRWELMADASGQAVVALPSARTVVASSLVGNVDIGVSMTVMALGMAYMLALS